jgi:hypothetical protein
MATGWRHYAGKDIPKMTNTEFLAHAQFRRMSGMEYYRAVIRFIAREIEKRT